MTEKDFVKLISHLRNPIETDVRGFQLVGVRDVHVPNIDISGYFSGGIVDLFCNKVKQGCKIRLLSPPLNLDKRQDRKNLTALKRMQDGGTEIRINERNHARFLINYKTVEGTIQFGTLVIGSFDFNKEGLSGERKDAGIVTHYPDLVKSAVAFFNEIWESQYETETLDSKYPTTR